MIIYSELFAAIVLFTLTSGLVVLWWREADDLDAWGMFVMRVLRGERRRGNSDRDQSGVHKDS